VPLALLLSGCSQSTAGLQLPATGEAQKANLEKSIQDIQNNPKMPQAAKNAAIAGLKKSQAAAQSQAQPPK